MVELRIELPEDLKRKMAEIPVDWSIIIAAFIRNKVSEWARLRSIVSKSRLTEEDALEIGRKINAGLAKRYKELKSSK